jgi:NADP-dependent 3-hydroxy acid dehydrogenase YdfG
MIDINIKGVLWYCSSITNISKTRIGAFINLSSAAGVKVFSPEEQFTAVLNLQLVLSLKAYVTK